MRYPSRHYVASSRHNTFTENGHFLSSCSATHERRESWNNNVPAPTAKNETTIATCQKLRKLKLPTTTQDAIWSTIGIYVIPEANNAMATFVTAKRCLEAFTAALNWHCYHFNVKIAWNSNAQDKIAAELYLVSKPTTAMMIILSHERYDAICGCGLLNTYLSSKVLWSAFWDNCHYYKYK